MVQRLNIHGWLISFLHEFWASSFCLFAFLMPYKRNLLASLHVNGLCADRYRICNARPEVGVEFDFLDIISE